MAERDPPPGRKTPIIVGIGGTTRAGSTTERLVAAVLSSCAEMGAQTHMFGGDALLALPHYEPETSGRNAAQRAFIDAVRTADGFVLGTPGYHGSVSALVKNAIDLIDDTRTDTRAYFDGCPVGLVVTAAGWQATGVVMSAFRDIVHALRGWPTPLGVAVNAIAQRPFGDDAAGGEIVDPAIAEQVTGQARQIMALAQSGYAQRVAEMIAQTGTASTA
ncbi:MAG: NAD(P)H-dependent oxidoreductase [Sphingomonadales bacterium]|nr:NAD(P)H-dependent oxidoreductase [Sphingomonadales bacterium]